MNKLYNKIFSRIFTVACHAYFRLGMGYRAPHRVRAIRKTTDEIWKKMQLWILPMIQTS